MNEFSRGGAMSFNTASTYTCEICGKVVIDHPRHWRVVKRVASVCSDCRSAHERKKRTISTKTQRVKKKLVALRGSVCESCGADDRALDAHHITPSSRGGATDATNLILLCENCHLQAHRDLAGAQ